MRAALIALAACLVAVVAAAPAGASADAKRPKQTKISAKAFVAIDAGSGRVIIGRNEQARHPIASLTKMMTGLLVIERGHLGQKITVRKAATTVEPYREGLIAGRRYTRDTLLWSTLLVSGNDSATALAIDAGGGSLAAFYARMNARARQIGMRHTTYASASGLDDVRNRSTALDQALLARIALRNPIFARIVGTERRLQRWPAPTYAKEWINHNRMLGTYRGTYGVKTGWTTRAGGCLAVAVKRGNRAVIAVVLGSRTIWDDMPLVVESAFRAVERG